MNSTAQNYQSFEVDSAPIVRLVNSTIELAVSEGASDIHIEPMSNEIRVRFRVDGKLHLSKAFLKPVLQFLLELNLAGLDIAEKRIPQDGRFDFQFKDKLLNIRVSVLPTAHGEKVVMRILDKTKF